MPQRWVNDGLRRWLILTGFCLSSVLFAQTAAEIEAFEREVLRLTNIERANQGLPALEWDSRLGAAARKHSQDMARTNNLSHTGSDGSRPHERSEREGFEYSFHGENIATGQATPANVLRSWMNSPGHRSNILNREYTHLGVGLASSAGNRNYWTQKFGRPSTSRTSQTPTTQPTQTPAQTRINLTPTDRQQTVEAAWQLISRYSPEGKYVIEEQAGSRTTTTEAQISRWYNERRNVFGLLGTSVHEEYHGFQFTGRGVYREIINNQVETYRRPSDIVKTEAIYSRVEHQRQSLTAMNILSNI